MAVDEAATSTATALAEHLLIDAERDSTRGERRRARRLGRLLADDAGREFLFALTDQVLRTPDARRAMRQLRDLVDRGVPDALSFLDRTGLRLAVAGSRVAAGPVAAVTRRRLRHETRGVIVPAEDPAFRRHVGRRRREGFDVNVNILGEAIIGDDEAAARLDALCSRMRRPDVGYVSVKISALCANLDVLPFDDEVERISECLRTVYATATERTPPVFVNLDMEEYRDLPLTVEAFCRVLDEPAYTNLPAGIVLQAYLPDSHDVLERLAGWAAARRRRDGAPIKVRLVKGANLAMELVDAELGSWTPAPYGTKPEVDASFKALVDRALDAAAAGDLLVGVGSHNLFDVGWALAQRRHRHLEETVGIEMLEGMAPAQSRATRRAAGRLVLYTPVVADEDFAASIAYLSRRLDENSGPENFLRSLLTVTPGSATWRDEARRFEAAVDERRTVSRASRRDQDRRVEVRRFEPDEPFANEPDTDFTRAANREWIAEHLAKDHPAELPPLVATTEGIDEIVARARGGAAGWRAATSAERRQVLARVAEVMAANRGRTLAVMAHETGKTVREGDPEVSEAVDFARWAAAGTQTLDELAAAGVATHPLGVVLVAGPWNFPLAIPTNGVVAALAGGNAVLLKPAPEAIATAMELVRHVHEAGVPPDVVQLVRCPDDDVGRHLVTHPGVDAVALTGAYETARMFLDWQPSLRLTAETSGKNAMVISQTADLDLALHDLVRSAFGHAGQKCSAASLAIVDGPLFDDMTFRRRLADAVRSLRVGPATDLASMVGPVIQRPTGKLERGLTELDDGESWLVRPEPLDGDRLWRPGVRIGVPPGSWFHQTECFGPVLGVMRADDLDHAIELQNAVPFGLTGGIHTLDDGEIEHWLERVEVGNAYINRHTTGAVVRRQPFGGWKRSSVGRSAKTGGPDDVLRFTTFRRTGPATPDAVATSYRHWWGELFGRAIDRSGLQAESNVLRYHPVAGVIVRVGMGTGSADVASVRAAAGVAGVRIEVSGPPGSGDTMDVVESDEVLARRIGGTGVERLRLLAPGDDALRGACHEAGVAVDETPVTHHGRVELPCWLREQAVSRTLHRHGRIPS